MRCERDRERTKPLPKLGKRVLDLRILDAGKVALDVGTLPLSKELESRSGKKEKMIGKNPGWLKGLQGGREILKVWVFYL